jgi:5-formyltetrahydrofolate cyclo-ligase
MDTVKIVVRKRMLQIRSAFNPEEKAKADQAIHGLLLRPWNVRWNTVLMYVNQPEEVATVPIMLELLERRKTICVPAFDSKLKTYIASQVHDFENDLETGRFGILEPKSSALRPVSLSEVDVVFVPGLAFDRDGNRLGYGYGYFDNMCRKTTGVKVGLAYHFQVVERIMPHSEDVAVDQVITEKGVIECRKP